MNPKTIKRKTQIRKGVFETNSSSTHTLVIAYDDGMEEPQGPYKLLGGSYYDSDAPLHTIEDRLNYLWQVIYDNTAKRLPDFDSEPSEKTYEWLDRISKIVSIDLPDENERWSNGWVDHSHELKMWLDFLENDDEALRAFILGRASSVAMWYDGYDEDEEEQNYKRPIGTYAEFRRYG